MIQQVSDAYAANKNKPASPRLIPSEPRQTSSREVIEETSTQLSYLHYSWHVPDVRHPDLPALDVMATLLGSGRSSRLYQNVRERKGVVNSADAWTYTPAENGLFGMSAIVNPDKLLGVLAMFGAIGILFILPWLDRSPVRSAHFRPMYKVFYWIFIINMLALGYLGVQNPEGIYLILGRTCTAWYFIHFLIIIPLLNVIETPNALPKSISDPIFASGSSDLGATTPRGQ